MRLKDGNRWLLVDILPAMPNNCLRLIADILMNSITPMVQPQMDIELGGETAR